PDRNFCRLGLLFAGVPMMTTALAFTGVLIGLAAVYLAVAPQRSVKRRASIDRFRRARSNLKLQIGSLYERSLAEQERFRHDKELPVLTREYWIPSQPLPLDAVLLQLREPPLTGDLAEARRKVGHYLPRRQEGGKLDTYSEAVSLYDRPQVWFDSCAY